MFDRLRASIVLAQALALLAGSSLPAAAQSSATGLSAAQIAQLHQLGFAVAPSPIPPGFHIAEVQVDTAARTYTIVYKRASDGAAMSFAGGPVEAQKKKSFLSGVGSVFNSAKNSQNSANTAESSLRSNSNEQVTPEQEQEMTDVTSDSALTGPIHFANNGACLSGSPDASKALITDAHFTVSACNLSRPTPLIRAYKSVVQL
jgi:hypothetical protein